MSRPPESDGAKRREKHRMAAIKRCNHAILSLRELTDKTAPIELNDISSEAEGRLRSALAEVIAFRTLIYTP